MRRFRSLPTWLYASIMIPALLLFPVPCSWSNQLFKQWTVRDYDSELAKLVQVKINGIAVNSEGAFQEGEFNISRLHLSLRVLDDSQVRILTLRTPILPPHDILLPRGSGKIAVNIFPPKFLKEGEIITLNVNHTFKLSLAVNDSPNDIDYNNKVEGPLSPKVQPLSPEGKWTLSTIEIASNVLSIDPYCIRAYQLLLLAFEKNRGLEREIQLVCGSQIAQLLEKGHGLNPFALYTLAEINRRNNQWQVAEAQYQYILETSPFFALAYLGLSLVAEERDDLDTSIFYLGLANSTKKISGEHYEMNQELENIRNRLEKRFHGVRGNDNKTIIQRGNLEFACLSLKSSSPEGVSEIYDQVFSDASIDDDEIASHHRLLLFNQALFFYRYPPRDSNSAKLKEIKELLPKKLLPSINTNQNSEFNRAVFTLLMTVTASPGDEENEKQYQYARWWLAHHPDNDLSLHIREALQTLKKLKDEDAYNELLLAQALMDLNPEDPRYLNNLAVVLASNGAIKTATQALRQALTLSPVWNGNPPDKGQVYREIYSNLSRCYESLGYQEPRSQELYQELSQEAKEMASIFSTLQ